MIDEKIPLIKTQMKALEDVEKLELIDGELHNPGVESSDSG